MHRGSSALYFYFSGRTESARSLPWPSCIHDVLQLRDVAVPFGVRVGYTRGRGIVAAGLRRLRTCSPSDEMRSEILSEAIYIPPFFRLSSALAFLAARTSGASVFSGSAVWMNGCCDTVSPPDPDNRSKYRERKLTTRRS